MPSSVAAGSVDLAGVAGSEDAVSLSTVALVATRLRELSAVGTTDWCDRAAEALALLVEGGIAVVGVVSERADQGPRVAAFGCGVASGLEELGVRSRECAQQVNSLRAHASVESLLGIEKDIDPRDAEQIRSEITPVSGVIADAWRDIAKSPIARSVWRSRTTPALAVSAQVATMCRCAKVGTGVAAALGVLMPCLVKRVRLALDPVLLHDQEWVTCKEQETLELLARGWSVKEIADALGRSPHTIHDHVKSLHRKLGAKTRGELVARFFGQPALDRERVLQSG